MSTALRAGTALAITAALGYAACALVFFLWPEIAANFVAALFHGKSGRFFYVLVVLAVWAFWLGALFGWLFERLGGGPSLALRRN